MIAVSSKEAMPISSDELGVRGANNAVACHRLDGWKEIAAYLRRSVRSVQRWERTERLPVLRHRHGKGATVYAYAYEVDRWWEQAKPSFGGDSTGLLQHLENLDQQILVSGLDLAR